MRSQVTLGGNCGSPFWKFRERPPRPPKSNSLPIYAEIDLGDMWSGGDVPRENGTVNVGYVLP